MRKVTEQIADAFHAQKSLKVGNTRTDGQGVYLHGNKIVERRADGTIWATLAGWETPTTRERLNGISNARWSQSKGSQYLSTVGEIDSREWYQVG